MANQPQHTKEGKVFLFRCGNFVFLFFFAFNRHFGGHLESQFGRYSLRRLFMRTFPIMLVW